MSSFVFEGYGLQPVRQNPANQQSGPDECLIPFLKGTGFSPYAKIQQIVDAFRH